VMIVFGIVGYLLKRFDYEAAPLALAFVLGPMLEVNLRRALLMSQGSFSIFVTRPIALAAILVSLVLIVLPLCQAFRKREKHG